MDKTKNKLPIIISGFKESAVQGLEENEKELYIQGLAIPFNTISSNGVLYTKESLIQSIPDWIGVPIMYNHLIEGESLPIGEVVEMRAGVLDGKEGLIYKGKIDKKEEKICGKIKDGYLKKVSIHIMPTQIENKSNYQEAVVGRPLELSVVPVPGFMETNMSAYMESLSNGDKMEAKENKESAPAFDAVANFEKLKQSFKEMTDIVEEMNDEQSELQGEQKELEGGFSNIVDVLQAITTRLDKIDEMLAKLTEDEAEEKSEEKPEDEKAAEDKADEIVANTTAPEAEPAKEEKIQPKVETVADEVETAKEKINNMISKSENSTRVLLRDI